MDVTTNTELAHVHRDLTSQIDRVEQRLDGRIDRLEDRFGHLEERFDLKIEAGVATLRAEFHSALRENTRTLMLAMVTITGFSAVITSLVR